MSDFSPESTGAMASGVPVISTAWAEALGLDRQIVRPDGDRGEGEITVAIRHRIAQ
jgi:hypothetical protein